MDLYNKVLAHRVDEKKSLEYMRIMTSADIATVKSGLKSIEEVCPPNLHIHELLTTIAGFDASHSGSGQAISETVSPFNLILVHLSNDTSAALKEYWSPHWVTRTRRWLKTVLAF